MILTENKINTVYAFLKKSKLNFFKLMTFRKRYLIKDSDIIKWDKYILIYLLRLFFKELNLIKSLLKLRGLNFNIIYYPEISD